MRPNWAGEAGRRIKAMRYFVSPGVDNPRGLIRSDDGGLPEYLARDGAWIPQAALMRYTVMADLGADEVDEETARGVAVRLGAERRAARIAGAQR